MVDLNLRERPDRIGRRDYFLTRTPIEKWKRFLSWFALFVTLGWVAGGFLLRPGYAVDRYSHGTLNHVHATWDLKCDACHEVFSPVNENTWLRDWWSGPGSVEKWRNPKCEGCHAGPAHHQSVKADSMGTCASCHRDHQGREHSLVSLPDFDCTRCHRDANTHMKSGESEYASKIRNFYDPNAGHPDFRVTVGDPATQVAMKKIAGSEAKAFDPNDRGLRFSHSLHMTLGQEYPQGVTPREPTRSSMTYSQMVELSGRDAAVRYLRLEMQLVDHDAHLVPDAVMVSRVEEKMKLPPEAQRVQLSCIACHQLDNTDFKVPDTQLKGLPVESLSQPRTGGAYFQPINYEKHCSSCHVLSYSDGQTRERAIQHRLQPAEIEKQLERTYTAEILKQTPTILSDPFQKSERLDPRQEDEKRTLWTQIAQQVKVAKGQIVEKSLCLKCHESKMEGPNFIDAVTIKPTRIPTIWMPHSKFDHQAHRSADCTTCHNGCKAPHDEGSSDPMSKSAVLVEKEPLHLPGIDNCRACHAPNAKKNGVAVGGARYNCTECHRYHDADHPLAGPGSIRNDPVKKYQDSIMFRQGKREP